MKSAESAERAAEQEATEEVLGGQNATRGISLMIGFIHLFQNNVFSLEAVFMTVECSAIKQLQSVRSVRAADVGAIYAFTGRTHWTKIPLNSVTFLVSSLCLQAPKQFMFIDLKARRLGPTRWGS